MSDRTVYVRDRNAAIAFAATLDRLEPDEERTLINGRAALRVIEEYGRMLYKCTHPGEGFVLRLGIVIDGSSVYIIPSRDGIDGIFVEPYDAETHGVWAKKLTKESLWDFCNINAMLDGWAFVADLLHQSWIVGGSIDE